MNVSVYSTMVLDSPPKGYGGLESIAYLLAKHLDETGHKVNLFATRGSFNPKNGLLFSVDEAGKISNYDAWKSFWATEQSRNALKNSDIICDMDWQWMPYAVHNELKHLCHVIHAPDPGFKAKPPMVKPNVMAVGFYQAKMLHKYTGFDVRAVQNGIELAKYPFNPKPIAERQRILWISRLFFPKGAHRAIQIAKQLNMPIDIVGGSFGDPPEYTLQIQELCKQSNVVATYHGEVTFDKKIEFYRNAKCVILPLVEDTGLMTHDGKPARWDEPFGLITPEANACGTPVIVSPNGGFMETMLSGYNGFFANSNEEFQYYIKRVDEIKPENCRRMAERFDYHIMGENYLKYFKEIIEGRGW